MNIQHDSTTRAATAAELAQATEIARLRMQVAELELRISTLESKLEKASEVLNQYIRAS
ncbi:MAG: hypothetical protein IT435_05650 [Phycisphaerales bacterium]|nr:hypothetical protein [Phycisphaerales bacterium]